MAEAGSIEIALRARVDRLEADLRKAEMATKKTSSGMKANFNSVAASLNKVKGNAAAAAAVIVGLGTGAMANLAKQAIRTANDLGDTAQKLGISTSSLQEFQFAANQSGVRIEALNMGLQRFGRRAAEAAQGTGEAKDAIKQLGIELKDGHGNLRTTEDLFTDAMTSLAAIENPLERVRLGFKLFDSEGVAMVNMAENFGDLREEAQRLGLVLDDEVIARADVLQDSFDALSLVTKGQLSGALTDLGGGALLSVAESMAELATWANSVYRAFADIENLGLSNLKELRAELEAVAEDKSKRGRLFQHLGITETEADVRSQIETIDKLIAAREKEREDRKKDREAKAARPSVKPLTTAEIDKAEAKSLKGIETRRDLEKRAHDEYLQASGQKVRAIEEELAADIAALTVGLQEKEDYTDAIFKLEQTAALNIQAIRDKESKDLQDILAEQNKAYEDLFEFMERGFSDALATMLLDGELTFKTLAESFLREFVQMGISKLVASGFGALSSIFGGINPETGGANLAPGQTYGPVFTGPGAANGGHIGGPTLVGERGPELFIPSTSGFVANNNAMRQMSGSAASPINVTVVNNTGQESSTSEKDGSNGGRDIEVMIGKAITKNIARGGDVDQAIRSSYGVQRVGRHGL
jgi:hypothetical protein